MMRRHPLCEDPLNRSGLAVASPCHPAFRRSNMCWHDIVDPGRDRGGNPLLTTRSASCSSLRQAPAARSRSVTDSPTRPSVQFATSTSSSRTSRPRGAGCLNVGSRSVRSGTRRPLQPGTEVSRPGSTPRAETMPASPTSPIRMATAGCYRNGATGMSDAVWKLGDVEHARRSRNT